jgi:hypothetical protein
MMPQERIRDIMLRTMKNLEFIYEYKKKGYEVYEVTQLINSFLGALAHPWEVYRDKLNDMSLDVAAERGWPIIKKGRKSDKEIRSLGAPVKHIRNGIAHGHVTFKADAQKEFTPSVLKINTHIGTVGASGVLSSQPKI